ncbi:MAG: isochorismatase family protein [Bacteroidales bacterium]|nr:isochorismatase family protein [Bacteroidales bacterium]
MKDSALVVVDMLYDFIDGSMACQGADGAVAGTLKAIDRLTAGTDTDESGVHSTYPILFVRDHHPADHCSFTEQGGPWPPHCVQGTHGADVHEALLPYVKEDLTFFKGEDPAKEQYSGFEVSVLADALAWVDAQGHEEALKAMDEEGIHLI